MIILLAGTTELQWVQSKEYYSLAFLGIMLSTN